MGILNVFALHWDPAACAAMHADQHVGKMLIESCQLLCNAARTMGFGFAPYKPTHCKHPCSLWAGRTPENYAWLSSLAIELAAEWRWRWPERLPHASEAVAIGLRVAAVWRDRVGFPVGFALALPDQYKGDDPIASYRRYYAAEKRTLQRRPASWTRRPVPDWFDRSATLE